jgi:hypothetical protein
MQVGFDIVIAPVTTATSYTIRYKITGLQYAYQTFASAGTVRLDNLVASTQYNINIQANTQWGLTAWLASDVQKTTNAVPASATVVTITSSRLVYTSTDGTLDGSQPDANLTAVAAGITGNAAWTISSVGSGTPAVLTTPGQTAMTNSVTAASFGTNKSVTIRCTVGGSYGEITLYRLEKSTAAAGATVGATWGTNVTSIPANVTTLAGYGTMPAAGADVTSSVIGSIPATSFVAGVQNTGITLSAYGVLSGGGTSSAVTPAGISAIHTNGTGAPATLLNSSITVDTAGKLTNIGTANVVVDNSKNTKTTLGLNYTDGADITANNKALGLDVPDVRNDNELPSFYYAKGRGVYSEFKNRSTIGAPGSETYGSLQSNVPWGDFNGGVVVQTFHSGPNHYRRYSTSTTVWGSWITIADGADVTASAVGSVTPTAFPSAVQNSTINVDASGLIQGIGTGTGTAVKNSLLDGAITSAATTANWSGIESGSITNAPATLKNSSITLTNTDGTIALGNAGGGAVTAEAIVTDTSISNSIFAGTVNADRVNAGTLAAGVIWAGALSADQISAITIDAAAITTGTITAGRIDLTQAQGVSAIFSTAGSFSFTVPAGMTSGRVTMWGAGGASTWRGGGGGGGCTVVSSTTVTPGANITGTVGTKGAQGTDPAASSKTGSPGSPISPLPGASSAGGNTVLNTSAGFSTATAYGGGGAGAVTNPSPTAAIETAWVAKGFSLSEFGTYTNLQYGFVVSGGSAGTGTVNGSAGGNGGSAQRNPSPMFVAHHGTAGLGGLSPMGVRHGAGATSGTTDNEEGYVFIEVWNPKGVVTRSLWDVMKTAVNAHGITWTEP